MSTWIATNRLTGLDSYPYESDTPTEFPGMEFATHNHVRVVKVSPPAGGEGVWVTKQEFYDRLGPGSVTFLLEAARTNIEIEGWIKRVDWVTPNPDGRSIDLTDPRTVAGVTQLGALMQSMNVVPEGWAARVLSGN